MPLYEYECKSCHQVVEVLVRGEAERSGGESPECPECGDPSLERLLSVPAAPAVGSGGRLPMTGGGEACSMPKCCGGGCQM